MSLKLHRKRPVSPIDQIVFGEAASLYMVVEKLLREVLMHLRCFMSFHRVPTCLVEIPQQC